MTRPSLLFVTPAFQRFELTRICLAQRARAIARLDRLGIDASAVVVADDDNLETADQHGFHRVERDNRYLGRRFNDGYQLAVAEGYDYAFAVGSDSWIDPAVFVPLVDETLDPSEVMCTPWYSVVRSDGLRRTTIRIDRRFGVGFCIPVPLLAAAGGRPCRENKTSGCDSSTLAGVRAATAGVRYAFREQHPLEYVAFQSGRTQITDYDRLHRGHHGVESADPFTPLVDVYTRQLVDRVEGYYASGHARVA